MLLPGAVHSWPFQIVRKGGEEDIFLALQRGNVLRPSKSRTFLALSISNAEATRPWYFSKSSSTFGFAVENVVENTLALVPLRIR